MISSKEINTVRILAIELSSFTGSVALAIDDKIELTAALPDDQRSAQSLIPTIKSLASAANWPFDSLDLICLTTGPGSFTSLRIAVTAAKVLAWSINADVVAVNTLRATAAQAFEHDSKLVRIVAVMDAQRKQLFSTTFRNEAGNPVAESETTIQDRASFTAGLETDAVITGSGVEKVADQISATRQDTRIIDREFWQPQAADVLRVGLHDFNAGQQADRLQLVPQYYRQSAAEENADLC